MTAIICLFIIQTNNSFEKDESILKSVVPSNLREINKSIVINIIKNIGPISRAYVAKEADLTRATTSQIVQELINDGIILETGIKEGALGRKGILLKYNDQYGYVVGIDLGGSKITFGLFDYNNNLKHRKTIQTFQVNDRGLFIKKLVTEIRNILSENGKAIDELKAIGIASPGIIDFKSGIVIEGSPNLPDWKQFNLKQVIEKEFNIPVIVENDVRAALIGEFLKGKCRTVHSAVLISLGTGIGSAMLIDGKIIRGAGNAAGEIGYMLFEQNHLSQDWGDKGCFETLASGSGLLKQAEKVNTSKSWLSTLEIFEEARKGEEKALQLLDQFINYLAISINNIITVANPEKIVLTGGLSRSSDLYLDKVNNLLAKHTFSKNHVNIEVTDLFDLAAIYGAAVLALSYTQPDIEFLEGVSII